MSVRPDDSPLREIRPLVALGVPTALSQLGFQMLNVVDALMVGRLGVTELAAASLGNVWIFGTVILGMGLMFGPCSRASSRR
jgi:MATE family multidrug resistance protein